jgi:hypothetical protein
MSNVFDEKTLLLDRPYDGDADDSFLEGSDRAPGSLDFEPLMFEESELAPLEPMPPDQLPAQTGFSDTGIGIPKGGASHHVAASSATASHDAASFSRGLVDTYFRQMGDAAWLSREEEVALAKRIEACQHAMLTALCGVPMLVARIANWGREIAEGRFRLVDIVEPSVTGLDPGVDPPHGDVAVALHDREPTGLAKGQAGLASTQIARLDTIAALADEFGLLSRKRFAAVARGRELAKGSRARLHVLTARLADEVAAVGPRPERLSDLIEELERQQRVSRGAEHQPSPAAHGAGLPPSELRDAMAQVDQARREIKRVRERMVKAHLRLVASIARKYRQKARWTFSI